MFFKVIALYAITNVSTLLFITYFFASFQLAPGGAGYFLSLVIILALINYFSDPLIKFFTLKVKFLTIWLFNFLLYIPILYLVNAFAPGIKIKAGEFIGMNFGVFQINSFYLTDGAIIVISALILGFGAALIRWFLET